MPTLRESLTDPTDVGVDPARLARVDAHFARYVDDGRLPGFQVIVRRRGALVHATSYGHRDVEAGAPVTDDTLWRIYSMSKPITSVAAMALYERGAFALNDPVSRWLPELADLRVWAGGTPLAPQTVPAREPIRVWHLLSHTSGLTYGWLHTSPVDELYRMNGSDLAQSGRTLEQACELWGELPLLFEPGTAWNYSVATDVLGRLLEVLTGRPLDQALRELVTGPLGMADTGFTAVDPGRLSTLYLADGAGGLARHPHSDGVLRAPSMLSGGGGMVSTAADYDRFTSMLLGGGEHEGVRVLGPRTLAYMTRNHLPGGRVLREVGHGQFAEAGYDGMGFGLGFAVVEDPVAFKVIASAGEHSWGGLASTAFMVDPVEQLTMALYTQVMPSSAYPLRTELRQLVHAALVD